MLHFLIVMLNVTLQSVVMLNVVAPPKELRPGMIQSYPQTLDKGENGAP